MFSSFETLLAGLLLSFTFLLESAYIRPDLTTFIGDKRADGREEEENKP